MKPEIKNALFKETLVLGDNALILGHRLSEWCGHGPVLEQDMAITNIALDQLGHCRMWLQLAGEIEGENRDEDDLAYTRDVRSYRNAKLVEQPNGDFAHTIVRQYLFDQFNFLLYDALTNSPCDEWRGIARKALKEIKYHLRYSSEWMVRLGDGTEESHRRMQEAVEELYRFSGALCQPTEFEQLLHDEEYFPDLGQIGATYRDKLSEVMENATLDFDEDVYMQRGGKNGQHTEELGYILAELQYMQRAYPGLEW